MPISGTDFHFPGQISKYSGKVRDVYNIRNKYLVMVASDRISAFDHILPRPIPDKGRVLNGVAYTFMKATEHLVPNWLIGMPHPNVTIGRLCEPFRIEMVIRGYLTGHAWREYKSGKRILCGVPLPEGMKENDPFPEPIITPATKADEGHDMDISKEEIIAQGIVPAEDYVILEKYTRALFDFGTKYAAEKGLILVDTKYEFGKAGGEIYLIDEIHTPDSSRYFYADTYQANQQDGKPQQQLSKEFVREWLMEQGFQGLEGQQMPEMSDEFVQQVSERYIQLYEKITGKVFEKESEADPLPSVEKAVLHTLDRLN